MNRTLAGLSLVAALAASPASARDRARPPNVSEPCPAYGAGFVRMPGSRTCTRLSGRVTTGLDLRAGDTGARAVPGAAGRLAIDTRTESDLGPVRTYVRIGNGRR